MADSTNVPMEDDLQWSMDAAHDEDMNESSEDSDESMEEENGNEDEENDAAESKDKGPEVYLPGKPLAPGEELVANRAAYRMLHQAQTGAPCLSFDIIPDDLGSSRDKYPLSIYLLAGTQAARTHVNNLLVMKMSNLHGEKHRDEDEESDEESDEELSDSEDEGDKLPVLRVATIKHQGCVNRVRCSRLGGSMFGASWSELGSVHLWNLDEQLRAIDNSAQLLAYNKKSETADGMPKPIFTFKGHTVEGYGVDWSPTQPGTLATGDCNGSIHIWRPVDGGSWHIDQRPYNAHAPFSVEDLQWSPSEPSVLASCSVEKSIRIWDVRSSPHKACMLTAAEAHSADVNVISWNRKESRFIVSGGDDGIAKIWDLRQLGSSPATPVATFKQHSAAVTTIEWHPEESTVFASGGADDQIAQWDLAIEVDRSDQAQDSEITGLPPQLLFIHQGQSDVKELHWHPQCPGTIVSTAQSGFNVFRTISV